MNLNYWFLVIALAANIITSAQNIDAVINAKEVERIERNLASDEMLGRKPGTKGIEKAARFIADEFRSAGLQTWKGSEDYFQKFALINPKFLEVKGEVDDVEFESKKIIVLTTQEDLKVNEKSGYEYKTLAPDSNLMQEAYEIISENKNYIVFVNEAYEKQFSRILRFKQPGFKTEHSVVFILTNNTAPKEFNIKVKHTLDGIDMANLLGVLPGKSRPEEYVIFSAHYDHLGVGKAVNKDSIFNGANDDAAGTTAVLMLAKYFKKLNNNERTIIFAAFTAEESGGFGSQYFSKQLDPSKVVAMFNIEMIGTESKWGKNSAFITGFEKTDMGKILQKNLKGTSFSFYPDPYPEQDLFYRSDNATLAHLGVPAHSISTSKMDSEKYYHTVDDEIETLDMENMAAIIKAIAESSKTIVAGKDTPSRVQTKK